MVRTADGGLLVTSVDWQASPRSVVARRVSPDGTLDPVKRVAGATGSSETVARTALAPDPAGGAMLVFNSAMTIQALRLDASATPRGAAVEVGAARGRWPDVAFSGTEYLVVWDQLDETFVPAPSSRGGWTSPGSPWRRRSTCRPAGRSATRTTVPGSWPTASAGRGSPRGARPRDRAPVVGAADARATAARSRTRPRARPRCRSTIATAASGVPALSTRRGGTLVTGGPPARARAGRPTRRCRARSRYGGVRDGALRGARHARRAALLRSTRADASFECRLDEGGWEPCAASPSWSGSPIACTCWPSAPPVRRAGSSSGRAPRRAGAPKRRHRPRITRPPVPKEHWTSISFAADEAALFECRLDGGAWERCATDYWREPSLTGGYSKPGLAEGPHVFEVRARDESGRLEADAARWAFTLDRRAPTTRIVRGPGPRSTATPVFAFSADELGVTYECHRGDSTYPDEWKPCVSGQAITWVTRSIEVRATDAAGNVGSPDKYEWGLDPYADAYGNTGTLVDHARYSITPRAGSVAECSRNGTTWWRCPALVDLWDVQPGEQHPLRVRGVGADGTIGSGDFSYGPGSARPTVPQATIVGRPPARTTARSARVAWVASGPAGSFVCAVDGGAEQSCSSPLTLDGLAPGEHTVRIAGRAPGVPSSPWEGTVVGWQVVERGAKAARGGGRPAQRARAVGRPGPARQQPAASAGTGTSPRASWARSARSTRRRTRPAPGAPGQRAERRAAHVRGTGVQRRGRAQPRVDLELDDRPLHAGA